MDRTARTAGRGDFVGEGVGVGESVASTWLRTSF